MTPSATVLILQDILRRESRSLLLYMEEAFPWMSAQEQSGWEKIAKLIAAEREALRKLATLLTRRHAPLPYIAPVPEGFTALNFSSLDYLLRLLIEEQKKNTAALERDLALLTDPEVATAVRHFLEMKQHYQKTLEALASGQPANAAPEAAAHTAPAAH